MYSNAQNIQKPNKSIYTHQSQKLDFIIISNHFVQFFLITLITTFPWSTWMTKFIGTLYIDKVLNTCILSIQST